MATLIKRKSNGRFFVVLYAIGRQFYIYPGTGRQRDAERFLERVQELEDAARAGAHVKHVTAAWVADLLANPTTHRQYDSLARAGLVVPRQQMAAAEQDAAETSRVADQAARDADEVKAWPLLKLIDSFLATLTHIKPQTMTNYRQSRATLLEHFGPDRTITTINAADARAFRNWMASKWSQATCSKRTKQVKAIFRHAVDSELIAANPFRGVAAGPDTNPERQHYVAPETMRRVIDAASDAEWKLIIGLAYYAGLRCPSEVLALRWADVDFTGRVFTVDTPKTTGHGRAKKRLPIFPELMPLLAAVRAESEPGAVNVVTKRRLASGNLSTQVRRFIRRAEVAPWPKLFNNLRSSRRNDLTRMHKWPSKALDEWFGHDEKTASTYYMMTTAADYQLAADTHTPGTQAQGSAQGSEHQAQGKAQGNGSAPSEIEGKPETEEAARKVRLLRELLDLHGLKLTECGSISVTPTGIEPVSRP